MWVWPICNAYPDHNISHGPFCAVSIYRALLRWKLPHTRAVHLQPPVRGAGSARRRARGGGRGRGWPARGGRWAVRPPARSPMARVVAGGARTYDSGLLGVGGSMATRPKIGPSGGGGSAGRSVLFFKGK